MTIDNLPFPVLPVALPAFGDTLAIDGSFELSSGCLGSLDLDLSWVFDSGDIVMAGRYVALIQGTFVESCLNCSYECGASTMVENENGLRDLPKNVLTSLGPIVKDKVIKGGQTRCVRGLTIGW